MPKALVTGCAGFVGSHLTEALLADGHAVTGVDCFSDNYAVGEKLANLARVRTSDRFELHSVDLATAELGPLLDRLRRDLPAAGTPVPAHGDFHVDQLLVGDEVAVVDFDQMCLAAPALYLATYAADVVRGRDGDLEAVEATLAELLDGYGSRPDDLGWHLRAAILGRVAHPFHRQVPDWPNRVDLMLRAAEAARA